MALRQRGARAGVLIGVVAAVVVGLVATGPAQADTSGAALYGSVKAMAEKGDERAAGMLGALDDYLAANGLQPSDLSLPAQAGGIQNRLITLRVEDHAPLLISIDNDASVETSGDLDAYVALRDAALQAVAASDPDRRVSALIAPSGLMPVAEFLAALTCPCEAESIVVDIFAGDAWLMASGQDLQGAPDAEALVGELLDQAAVSIGQFPGVRREDLRATVRSMRVGMAAKQAEATARSPEILLVDIAEDILDSFRGRAVRVELRGRPDVFGARVRLVLGDVFEKSRRNPGEIDVVPGNG